MISDKAVLVTGGAGFIGSHTVHALVARNDTCVINLDALSGGPSLETLVDLDQNPAHYFVLGSIGDRCLVDYLLERYQPYAVVNLAAYECDRPLLDASDRAIRTNVLEMQELLQAVARYWKSLDRVRQQEFRFLQISSDSVYGDIESGSGFTEESPMRPNSLYAASKASADHLVRCFYQGSGLPVCTLRASNIYGPYEFPGKPMPWAINRALEGLPIELSASDASILDWLYVDDLCRSIELVLERGGAGEVYNLGSGDGDGRLGWLAELCAVLDEVLPDSPNRPHSKLIQSTNIDLRRDRHRPMDIGKIQRETGWSPSVSMRHGLKNTINWYRNNQDWSKKVLESYDLRNCDAALSTDLETMLN